MAKEYNFIEYTKETAEAIRKARDLPTRGDGQSPWPEHSRQQLLPPMMTNVSEGSAKHPFDVQIINTGTEESPSYAVKVYNSALPDSDYAGIVYIGTSTYSVPVDELALAGEAEESFWVDLVVTYDAATSPVYTIEFEIRTDEDYEDEDNVFRQTIAMGGVPEIASMQSENIRITDRWV